MIKSSMNLLELFKENRRGFIISPSREDRYAHITENIRMCYIREDKWLRA